MNNQSWTELTDEAEELQRYREWRWEAPLIELTDADLRQIGRITDLGLQVRRMSSGPFRHGFAIFKNKEKDGGEFTTADEDVIEVLGSDEGYSLSWLFPTYEEWMFVVAHYSGGQGPGDFWHKHDSLQSAVEDVIDFYSRPERMDRFSEFCRKQYEATNPVGHRIKVPPDHPNYENWIKHKTGGAF